MNKKEKILADREIALYRERKTHEIDKELFLRTQANWDRINKAREDRRDAEVNEGIEIAKLKAKREALAEVFIIKDQEILLLKEILTKICETLKQPIVVVKN